LPAADLSSTRRVSLGRKDKSDLQVVSLERQESFSSTSTDYEEIDLSERTPQIHLQTTINVSINDFHL